MVQTVAGSMAKSVGRGFMGGLRRMFGGGNAQDIGAETIEHTQG